MARIGETLRQLRLERGMTQEEVAERVGLTRQAVSGYEAGRTQPGVDILERLAEVYRADLTDIIYGRNRSLRLYNSLKITAVVMAAVILAAQFAASVLLWVANRFFALAPGQMSEADKLVFAARSKLIDAWTLTEGIYSGLFPLFCVAVLVLLICQSRPIRAKVKVLCTLCFAAASMAVVLPWALMDPAYPPVNYLIVPRLCLAELVLFLLLSLVIDFFRGREQRSAGEEKNCGTETEVEASVHAHKRRWFWLAAAVVMLCLLVLIAVFHTPDQAAAEPVTDPAFTLNGEMYPKAPVLQDFLDRGWKLGKSGELTGTYSEETGISDLVQTGYRLNWGENHIDAYLEENAIQNGTDPSRCRLRSLSLYGDNVMSFSLDGEELVGISRVSLEEALGEPDRVRIWNQGIFCRYFMPEKGISEIQFTFSGDHEAVSQIFVIFEMA